MLTRLLFSFLVLCLIGPSWGDQLYTCMEKSRESKYKFCDLSASFEERTEDLVERLNTSEKLGLFFSYPSSLYIPRLNIEQWNLDHTCIHGVNKEADVTVFPHAIAQGASWDLRLVRKISLATAKEARIISYAKFRKTKGKNFGFALSCDGGPLANSAHDPRWGRIAETYGEDPYLIKQMGVTALNGLQNPIPVKYINGTASVQDYFLATRQVTRHFLGYHVAKPDIPLPIFNVSKHFLEEFYFPVFQSFQVDGKADGIMCAMTMLRINGDKKIAPCGSAYLIKSVLRGKWGSDALVQSDCCDSVSTMNVPFHFMNITSDKEALKIAMLQGEIQTYYGYKVNQMKEYLSELVNEFKEVRIALTAAAKRVLLSFFRLGFFDAHRENFPFRAQRYQPLSSYAKEHKEIARNSVSSSLVLLKNKNSLPIPRNRSVALIGPFANCTQCHLHSYNGKPLSVSSILDSMVNDDSFSRIAFRYGSNISCSTDGISKTSDCWKLSEASTALKDAEEAAQNADFTILCLGLGSTIEAEGIDRVSMRLPKLQEILFQRVASVAKNLIVVIISAGGVDFDESVADSIIWMPYGGQEAGYGLLDVITGKVSPSGKLPITFYKQEWIESMKVSILNMDLDASLGRTYQFLQGAKYVKHNFGYGLSFTSWRYTSLRCNQEAVYVYCSVTLENNGNHSAYEITQVYASSNYESIAQMYTLVAFQKNFVTPQNFKNLKIKIGALNLQRINSKPGRPGNGFVTIWVGGSLPSDVEALPYVGTCQKTIVKLKRINTHSSMQTVPWLMAST